MKRKIVCTFVTLLSYNILKSQGGNPGNGFPFSTFLGFNATSFNNPLEIRTSNLNRFLIRQNAFGAQMQNYPGSLLNPLPGFRQTRIGISRDGLNPVTLPQSLLHLGYDSFFGGSAGRRSWEEIGTMYSAETDNFYVGLRQKVAADPTGRQSTSLLTPNDAQDAVIAWGDNFSGINPPSPDNNLAFIFHAPTTNILPYVGTDYGREVMRMNGTGNVGIGPVFFDNAQPQSIPCWRGNVFRACLIS